MSQQQTKGTALVTGSSSGIGALYADRLARRGYDLILVARDKAKLDALAAKLAKDTGRKVEVLAADLNAKADLRRVEDRLKSDANITALINNAGIGSAGPLLTSNVDQMDAMIQLNVVALTRLALAAAPAFVARKNGTIVNIASINFTQALHKEFKGSGVKVQAVLPGATATNFWDVAGVPVAHLPAAIVMQADEMVDAALAGLDLGELITIPSLPDAQEWDSYDAARKALGPKLSRTHAASRYKTTAAKQSA